jgi:hypothetical protein
VVPCYCKEAGISEKVKQQYIIFSVYLMNPIIVLYYPFLAPFGTLWHALAPFGAREF